MATVTGSYVVSRSACLNYQGRTAEAKVNSPQITLNKRAFAYDGLRSLNKLHVRTARVAKTCSSINKAGSERVSGKIVCGSGMNLVFVGAEVGPWSKTGGLGDVLGGLPPALAVSEFQLPSYFHTHSFSIINIKLSIIDLSEQFFYFMLKCFDCWVHWIGFFFYCLC